MRKKLECQRRPYGPGTAWPVDGNRRAPMDQPPMGQYPGGPAMPGHMQMPMPSGMPYPWMQRPMPGQWMPGMENAQMAPGMRNSGMMNPAMGNMGMMEPNMGLWNMDRWTANMWNPDMEDMDERKDMEYWQQMYPAHTRRVQREVEHQCDLLDYEGSVMYDEYPDRISLSRICESVYQALMQSGALENQGMMGDNMSGNMAGNMTQNSSSEFEDGMDMDGLTAEEEAAGARGYQPIGQVDMMQ
ncbi:MAG: hypothetical protein J6I64_08610, partial [Lachnospiraceae bacterium]|nr:hypothetical protein [Lachnospiraceae bacterium]